MTAAPSLGALCEQVRDADSVVGVGSRTHWEVGGVPSPGAVEVHAPAGVVSYDPADLTVAVAAGTQVGELAAVLAEHGQECPIDSRDPAATIGGVLATGLSGHRRLRYGPVRDRVLEVRFVTADGRVVKGGGPTVKNVSGFDLPRLLVGSFGTIGVIVQAILRCQPLAPVAQWHTTPLDPFEARLRAYRASCVAWDGRTTRVLLEGVAGDLAAQRSELAATPLDEGPRWPDGAHRGRASVRPRAVRDLGAALDRAGVRWLAEIGVGTVHVGSGTESGLVEARRAAEAVGGWLLREAGAPGLDGFGRAPANGALQQRVRDAFDPHGKFAPGRFPILRARVEVDVHVEGSRV